MGNMGAIGAGINGFLQGMQLEKQMDPEGYDNDYGTKGTYSVPKMNDDGTMSYSEQKMTARQHKLITEAESQKQNSYISNMQVQKANKELDVTKGQDTFSNYLMSGDPKDFNAWNAESNNQFGGNLKELTDEEFKGLSTQKQQKIQNMLATLNKNNEANAVLGITQDKIVSFVDYEGNTHYSKLSDVAIQMKMPKYVANQKARQTYFTKLATTTKKAAPLTQAQKLQYEKDKLNQKLDLENISANKISKDNIDNINNTISTSIKNNKPLDLGTLSMLDKQAKDNGSLNKTKIDKYTQDTNMYKTNVDLVKGLKSLGKDMLGTHPSSIESYFKGMLPAGWVKMTKEDRARSVLKKAMDEKNVLTGYHWSGAALSDALADRINSFATGSSTETLQSILDTLEGQISATKNRYKSDTSITYTNAPIAGYKLREALNNYSGNVAPIAEENIKEKSKYKHTSKIKGW